MLDNYDSLVDVVIPTYNDSKLVLLAIISALEQGPVVREIFVVDDGSSPKIVSELSDFIDKQDNVSLVLSERYSNPGIIRNIGLRKATAKYVAFLDSDDTWIKDSLLQRVIILEKLNKKFVCSNAYKINANVKTPYFLVTKRSRTSTINLIRGNAVITSTVVVRRDAFIHQGGFPEEYAFRGVEDYLAWLRFSLFSELHYLNEFCAEYMINESGLSQSSTRDGSIFALMGFYADLGFKSHVTVKEYLAKVFYRFLIHRRIYQLGNPK